MIGTIVLLYLGTRTVISTSGSVTYRTETRETVRQNGGLRFVHDETTLTLAGPEPASGDVPTMEWADRTYAVRGTAERLTNVSFAQRARIAHGAGIPGYDDYATFETSYMEGSVARVETAVRYDVPSRTGLPTDAELAGSSNVTRTTTTIAADGSYERKRTSPVPFPFREIEHMDGSYEYLDNQVGFSYEERHFTPVRSANAITGIAFRVRTRGRTIGNVPFATTEGVASVWFSGEDVPPFERRTHSMGEVASMPPGCPVGSAETNLDEDRTSDMAGSITDARTTTYDVDGTAVCVVSERIVQRYDVISANARGRYEERDVRGLQSPKK